MVTHIKNQMHCGACWAFGSTGAVESANAIKNGVLLTLSEQQLIDCAGKPKYKNFGCSGGYQSEGMRYVKDFGMELEDTYPFQGETGQCEFSPSNVVVILKDQMLVAKEDLRAFKLALAKGPLSVSMEGDTKALRFYHSGILDDEKCKTNLNHAAVAVGYGADENGQGYFLLKNSWGVRWGEKGYLRIKNDN